MVDSGYILRSPFEPELAPEIGVLRMESPQDQLSVLSIRELIVELAEVENVLNRTRSGHPGVDQPDDDQRKVLTAKAGRLVAELARRRAPA